ncbi:uncharacterized protein LOC106143467 [Amyelois transitella]|uniref:uncharacterized protein LOC106143467 n=1 Tax=Amyelois transitella TaxID=680683 RepID=UPI0029906CC4|nr:uncharacterized protein LOC106143467 [Amyelois transitella]
MRLFILLAIVMIVGITSRVTAGTDARKRSQSMYRMTELPPARKGGVKGARTTLRPLKKGEYVCGNRICQLRPGEVPRGCEGGECQYNVGYMHRAQYYRP